VQDCCPCCRRAVAVGMFVFALVLIAAGMTAMLKLMELAPCGIFIKCH